MAIVQAQAQAQLQPPGSEDQTQEVSHKVLVTYGSLDCPPKYVCGSCGAFGVRLWKDFDTRKPKLTCKTCTENITEETAAQQGELKGRIPAVPILVEDNGVPGFGYYFDVLEAGWAWWHGLKEEPGIA